MKRKTSSLILIFVVSISSSGICQGQPIRIPFTFSGRLAIVQATVNGRPGAFLLDTGSEGLALNQDHFAPRHRSKGLSIDIIGNSEVRQSTCVDLVLGELARKCEYARLADLSGLEYTVGHALLGVIGRNFFRKLEIMFDYHRQVITLFPLDKKGNRLSEPEGWFPLQIIGFRYKGHLPYVQAKVGELKLDMVIDSGAEVNLLLHKWRKKAGSLIFGERKAVLRGVGSRGTEVMNCLVKNLSLEGISYPPMETFLLRELPFNRIYSGREIDGILGFEFFRQHRVSINYRKRELSIWEIQGEAVLGQPQMAIEGHSQE